MNRSKATLLAGLLFCSAPMASALPEGPSIQSGTVKTQTVPGTLNIQQLTDRAIINWNSFSIGTNELVRVLQPNQAAILLNRVVGQDPSVILGQLQANGNIWLLNPNGILFGAGARVDVGGLLATTLNIQDKDFLAGRYNFNQLSDKPLSAVINQGELTVSPQGYVILSAPLVSNEGLIVANLGKIALVSGQHTTLSFDTKGLINYQLATAQATAGPVLLTPDMVSDVIRGVVQSGGVREGNLITQKDGRILLTHGDGTTINAGDIRAAGGSVTLDSNKATLLRPGSLISVSGEGAFVDAGQIKVLSQSATWAQPNSRLEASSASGKGGFIEVSGKAVSVASSIDVHGATQNGQFYLDPDFLRIIAGLSGSGDLDGLNPITAGDAPGTASTVTTGWLESLTNANISLEASNSVTVADGADLALNNSSLNITAITGNITFENPATTITTRQDVTLTAGNNIDVGTIVITPGGGRGFGGAVNLTAGNSVNLLNGGQITSQGGLAITATAGNITFQNASTPVSSNFGMSFQAGNDITLSNMTNSAFVNVNVTAGHDILVPSGASSSLTNARIILDAGNNITFADGNTQLQADTRSITLNAGNQIQLGRLSADSIIINASNGAQSAPGLLPGNSNLQAFSPPSSVNVDLTSENGSVNLSINNLGNLNVNAGNASLQNQGDIVTLGAVNVTNDFRLDNQGQVGLDSVENRQAGQNFVVNASTNISLDMNQGGTQIQGATVLLFAGNDISTTGFGEGFSPAINATNVGISAVGSVDPQVQVSATNVAVSAGAGDIDLFFVNDVNVANVGGINGINGPGEVIVQTLGNLTLSAPVAGDNAIVLADFDIRQNGAGLAVQAGNLTIAGGSIGTAASPIQIDVSFLSAESDTGGIFLADGLAADTHPNLTLLSGIGGPQLSGGLFSTVGAVNLTTIGNLAINDIVRGANVSLNATGSMDLGDIGETTSILALDQVLLSAGGNIIFSGSGTAVSANLLTVNAGGSIFLTGDIVQLSAQAGSEILFDNFAPSLSVVGINSTAGNVDFTSSGTISLDGTVQAAGAVNILAFDQITQTAGNVIAGTSIDVDTSGNLSSVPGSQFQGAEIALNANDISGLTVETPLLAAQSFDRIQIQANGSVAVGNVGIREGISAPNQVSLTSSGNLTVSSNVTSTNISLISNNGLLDVPGNVSASGVLDLQANNGSIQLQTGSTGADHALLLATRNITGVGSGPQLLANNVSLNSGNISLGLTSPLPGNVSLLVNASQNAVINSSSSLQVLNPSSAGGDLQLSTNGDMALSGTLSAVNTVALNVTGDLNVAAAAPTFQANALSLQVGTVSGSPVTTNVSQLAGFGSSGLSLNQTSSTPLTVSVVNGVIGLSGFGPINLSTQGPLNVNAGINGTLVNLTSSSGDINLNTPVVTGGLVNIDAQGGNLSLNSLVRGDSAQLSTSANLSGPGFVEANNISLTSGNDTSVRLGAPAPGTVALRFNAGTNAIISSTDSVNLNAASSAANDLQLAVTGNLTLNAAVSVANTLAFNVTGDLATSGAPSLQANALSLRVGNLTTNPVTVDVSQIAATSAGDLNIDQTSTTSLTVTTVNGVTGLTSSGAVNLTSNGPITVASSVSGDSVRLSAANINLNSTVNAASLANVVAIAGELNVNGAVNASTVSLTSSGALDVNAGLSGDAINLRAANISLDAPVNAVTLANVVTDSGTLDVNSTVQGDTVGLISAAALGVNGAVNGTDVLLSGQTQLIVNSGVNATNANLTAVSGPLNVNADVLASNVTLISNNANMSINASVQGSNLAQANAQNGNISLSGNLVGANAVVNASGNVSGPGNVTSTNVSLSAGNDIAAVLTGLAAGNIDLDLSAGGNAQLSSANSINLISSSVTNSLDLAVTGNLNLNGQLAVGNTLTLSVSNSLSNTTGSASLQADALSLTVGSVAAPALVTNVNRLAAQSPGDLNITNLSPNLQVGNVSGLAGVNATNLNLNTSGNLAVTDSIRSSGNTAVNALGDIAISGNVSAGNQVLLSANNLTGSGAGVHVIGGEVGLSAASIGPLTVSAPLLAASSGSNLNISTVGDVAVGTVGALSGLTAVNTITLDTPGALAVNAPVSGDQVVLSGANVNINSTVQGSGLVQAVAQNGNLTLTGTLQGARVVANTSANLTGPGSITSNNVGLTAGNEISDVQLAALNPGNIALTLTAGNSAVLTSSNSVNLRGSSFGNDLQLAVAGNLHVNNQISAGNTIALNVSGNLSNAGGLPKFRANGLSLRVGNITGAPISTDVSQIAATSGGDLNINQVLFGQPPATPLTVTSVNGVTGLTSPGALNLIAPGPLTVSSAVSGGSVRLSAANIDLNSSLDAVTLANVATTAGDLNVNGAVNAGTVNLTSAASLDVNGSLTSGGAINLSGTNISLDAPINAVTAVNAVSSSGNLLVNSTVQGSTVNLTSTLGAININGSINGTDVNLASQNLLTVTAGINATNANLTAATGGINASGNILASNTSLAATSGDVNLNATIQGSNLARVNAQNGNISLTGNLLGANALVNASANLTGPGFVTSNNVSLSAGNDITSVALAGLVAGNVDLTFTSGASAQITSANSVNLSSSSSVGNDLNLAVTGNLTLNNQLSAGNTLTLNVTNDLANSAASPSLQANALSLRVGNITGPALTTNVTQLAAQSSGGLNITNLSPNLQVGNVSGLAGVNATNVNLSTSGNLAVSDSIQSSGNTAVNALGDIAISGNVSAGNQVRLTANNLTGSGAGVHVIGGEVGLSAASIGPLTVSAPLLAASSSSNLSLSAVGDVAVGTVGALSGLSAVNNITLDTPGALAVNAPVNGDQVALSAANINLNSSLNATTLANVVTSSGDLNINGAVNAGTVNLTSAANLDANASLTGGAINLSGTNISLDAPVNAVTLVNAVTSSGDLNVNSTVQGSTVNLTSTLGAININGPINGTDVNLSSQNLLSVTAGINATNANLTASTGGINASGNILASNTSLAATSGDVNLNATIQGSNLARVNAQNGNISLTGNLLGGNVLVNSSANLTGPGTVTSNNVSLSAGNDISAVALAGLAAGNINLTFSAGGSAQLTSANSVNLSSSSSVGNDLQLAVSGNLSLNSPVTAGNTIALNVSGDLDNAGGTPSFQANALSLRVGNTTGAPITTNVSQIAANSGGDLNVDQTSTTPLTVTSVNGVTGLTSPGALNLSAQGPLTVSSPVSGGSVRLSAANIDLNSSIDAVTLANVATTAGDLNVNGAVNAGTVNLTSAASLDVNGSLTSGGAINLSGTNISLDAPVNAVTVVNAVSSSGNLLVNSTVQGSTVNLTSTLGATNINGAINGTDVNLASQNLLTVTAGINATNANLTASTGGININADVLASNTRVVANSGDISLNATVRGSSSAQVNAQNGNVSLSGNLLGANALVNSSTNLTGPGTVTSNNVSLSAGNDITSVALAGLAAGNVDLTFTAGGSAQITSANSVNLSSSSSVGNDLQLAVSGNLSLNSPVTAGNTFALNVSGDLDNAGGTPSFQANALSLRVGNTTGAPITTNVSQVAANSGGDLNIDQTSTTPLTVASVNGVTGLTSPGALNLSAQGPLTVSSPVSGGSVRLSAANIDLNSSLDAVTLANVATTAGDLNVNGAVNAGTVNLTSAANLAANASLTGGAINLSGTNISLDAPVNAVTVVNAVSSSGNLLVNSTVQGSTVNLTSTLGAININGSINGTDVNLASQNLLTVTAGINATNANLTAATGGININADVLASNTRVVANSGDISLNATIQGSNLARVNAQNGNISLTGNLLGANALVNASANLTGPGFVTSNNVSLSAGNDITSVALAGLAAGNVELTFTSGASAQITSANSVNLSSSSSVGNDLNLAVTGNLTLNNRLSAGNTLTLNVTNNLANSAASPSLQANALSLRVGNITGPALTTNVTQLAAQSSGGLNITNLSPNLQVGNVSGLAGVNATNVNLSTSGNLAVSDSIQSSGNTAVNALGDIAISGNVSAGNQVRLTANNLTGSGAGVHVIGGEVGLSAASIGPLTVSAPLLAASSSSNLSLSAVGDVAVGTVGALSGLSAVNNITLDTPGALAVNAPVNGDQVALSAANINLNSSLNATTLANVVTSSGDLNINGAVNAGTVNLTSAANLDANASLTGGAINLSGTNISLDAPVNAVTLVNAVTSSGDLNVNSTVQGSTVNLTSTLGAININGPINGTDVNLSSQNLLSVTAGINATNANLTASTGGINASGNILASNTSLAATSGDVNLNATIQGSNLARVNAQNGNISLTGNLLGGNVLVNSSANLTGPGTVTSNNVSLSAGNDISAVALAGLAAGNINLTFSAGGSAQLTSANSVNLSSSSSVGNDLQLAVSGNLSLNSPVTAGNTIALNVSGDLDNAGGTPSFQANALSLRVGNTTGAPITTNVSQIAANSGGDLNVDQTSTTPLTVTSVNGVTGLTSPGALNLSAQGPLTVSSPVSGGSVRLSAANIDLNSSIDAVTLANVATTAGDLNVNGAVNAGTVNLTSAASLDVNGSLTSGGAINLSGTNISLDAPVNAVTVVNAVSSSGNLLVNSTVQGSTVNLTSTLGAININGAINGTDVNLASQNLLTVTAGINATNANLTASTGGINASGNILASNTSLAATSGDVNLNATIQGSNLARVNAQNGNISLTGNLLGANALVNASANLTGPGTVTSNNVSLSAGNDITSVALAGLAAGNVDLTFTSGGSAQITSANSMNLSSSSSVGNDLQLAVSGNLSLNSPVTAGNTIALNVSGDLDNAGGTPSFQANALSLRVGNTTGAPITTNVSQVAANSGGDLNIDQTSTTPLTVASVNGVTGLTSPGALNLSAQGPLTVSSPVSGGSVRLSAANIDLNSSLDAVTLANVATTAGDLNVNGAVNAGTVNLTSAASLDVNGSLTSGGAINLSGTNISLDAPVNAVTVVNAVSSSGNLLVNSTVQGSTVNLTSTLGAININGAINGTDVNLASQNLLTVTAGINATNANLTAATGGININADVLASNTRVVANSGDISLNATVQGSNLAQVNAQNGNFSLSGNLVGANVLVNSSANLTGPGTVTSNNVSLSAGNDITSVALAGLAAGNVDLSFTAGNSAQINSASSVNLASSSSGNDLQLGVNGLLNIGGGLSAGNTLGLNVTGNLTDGSIAPSLQANSLGLRVGGVLGGPITTNVSQIAAEIGSSSLNLNQTSATPLTVTSVNGVTGLKAPGAVNLTTQGPLTVTAGVSGSNASLTSASGDVNINALVQSLGSTQVAAQGGNLNLSGPALSAPNVSASASGNISGLGTVSANNISLISGNRLNSLTLSAIQPGSINTNLSAPGGISLTVTNSMVLQGLSSTSLALTVGGDLNLVNTIAAGDVSFSLTGNLVSSNAVPDIQASNLQLNVGGNVGSSAAPLRLTGPTTVAGQVGQNVHLRTDASLTVSTVNGTVGLVAGPGAATEVDVDLTHGNLTLDQQLATNNGTINIAVRDGSMSGPGTLKAGNAMIRANGSIQVFTDVNGLAATSPTNNVNIVEANGLLVIGITNPATPKIEGSVSGITGANVSVIVNNGNLDLSDASLGNNPAIIASQNANLQAVNGNIVGVNPSKRPDVIAPQIKFNAGGSVGAPDLPIRISNGNQYTTSDPGYVEYFGFKPAIQPPGAPSLTNAVTDPTSLGLPVGNQLPVLVLKPASGNGSPGSPTGLWQVSWESPSGPVPTQSLQHPHLLDLSLEQLLDQPTVSGYILMPLEQLLDQPVINPFLQQSLEELIAADVVTIGDGVPNIPTVPPDNNPGQPGGNDQPTVDNPTPQNPDGPSISLTFNPDGSIKRIYLLDMNLEQLMDQPVISNYLHFTLQELLDTAVINPFLDNSLEQLMNTPVNPVVPQPQTHHGKGSNNAD